jgi:hypothetical protein
MRTVQWYRLVMSAAVLFCVLCLSVVHVDARGGGRGGSVRQSPNFGKSSGRSSNVSRQPARTPGEDNDAGSVRESDRASHSQSAVGGRYESFGHRDTTPSQPVEGDNRQQVQRKITGSGPTASQLPASERQQLNERPIRDNSRLNDEQKSELRKKYEDSGLTPEQLPGEGDREDWQDWRDEVREDWQDWYEDYWDDYRYYSPWWYGYPVSTVSYSYYINDTPPCKTAVVVDETEGRNTYYYCNATWYQPISSSTGETKYVVTTPPARVEVTSLSNPSELKVDGKEYYLSAHVFYQKIKRDGKDIYATVDAPVGAKVATIPAYAVEVEHKGKHYFRFGQTFYKKQGDDFVVVKNPGL